MRHFPQSLKQTYGCHCPACGELWDCYQVPCPIDVALRAANANLTCVTCGKSGVLLVMPQRYEELKQEANRSTSQDAPHE